jgi:hypothetical protein
MISVLGYHGSSGRFVLQLRKRRRIFATAGNAAKTGGFDRPDCHFGRKVILYRRATRTTISCGASPCFHQVFIRPGSARGQPAVCLGFRLSGQHYTRFLSVVNLCVHYCHARAAQVLAGQGVAPRGKTCRMPIRKSTTKWKFSVSPRQPTSCENRPRSGAWDRQEPSA